MDDAAFLEILNLISKGLASYNAKNQVPSDIPPNFAFLPFENFETQNHLGKISKWTENNEMLLNSKKCKYMIINFCSSNQFSTRLWLNDSLLDQVKEARLLGVILQDNLSWEGNTRTLVKRAYQRMIILRKLSEFEVTKKDMINIYQLFVRSLLEQSSVVWSSSLTVEQSQSLEQCCNE